MAEQKSGLQGCTLVVKGCTLLTDLEQVQPLNGFPWGLAAVRGGGMAVPPLSPPDHLLRKEPEALAAGVFRDETRPPAARLG
jgi:hypothetical protein